MKISRGGEPLCLADELAVGNTLHQNIGNNLVIVGYGLALDNTLRDATSVGLNFTLGGGYGRNLLTENNGGGNQVSGGTELGTNFCQTDTTCP